MLELSFEREKIVGFVKTNGIHAVIFIVTASVFVFVMMDFFRKAGMLKLVEPQVMQLRREAISKKEEIAKLEEKYKLEKVAVDKLKSYIESKVIVKKPEDFARIVYQMAGTSGVAIDSLQSSVDKEGYIVVSLKATASEDAFFRFLSEILSRVPVTLNSLKAGVSSRGRLVFDMNFKIISAAGVEGDKGSGGKGGSQRSSAGMQEEPPPREGH